LSIERWNNYPRVERINEVEHIALVLHYVVVLYYLEPRLGKNIDLYKIFVYIIWLSFFTFVYSDINSYVKINIKEKAPEVIDKLNKLVKDFLLSFNLPENIKEDIKISFNKKFLNENEVKLVRLAKLLTVRKEIEVNSKIYYSVYSKSIKNINNLLSNLSINLPPEKVNLIDNYINQVKRLKFSYRWNRLKRNYPVSVLSHLFIVFFISYLI
jgi:5'-deoxynucleotidase YfbR-like HD superfamily hydrolase